LDLEKLLFAINPDFRPVSAAKFLYDLFGPEKDEESLPPPFFVKAKTATDEPKSQTGRSLKQLKVQSQDDPTIKEEAFDHTTPIVKIPKVRRIPVASTLIAFSVFLIFLLGSGYAYYIHELNKKAYLGFSGLDPKMRVALNGKATEVLQAEVEVLSNTVYEVRIKKKGYKDFIQQLTLNPREHSKILVDMEKAIPPFGDLTVESTPPGAMVYIDNEKQNGVTPLTIKNLKHNQTYAVRLELENHRGAEREVKISGGKEFKLTQPLPLNFASLSVDSTPPGAEVYLNDNKVGVTPLFLNELIPNQEQKLRLALPGYHEEIIPLSLSPGEREEVRLELHTDMPAPENTATPAVKTDASPEITKEN
jgi:hypothetical protein